MARCMLDQLGDHVRALADSARGRLEPTARTGADGVAGAVTVMRPTGTPAPAGTLPFLDDGLA